MLALVVCVGVFAIMAAPAWSHDVQVHPHAEGSKAIPSTVPPDDICRPGGPCDMDHNRPEHGSLGNIGAKLSDPTSDVWALQFNIQGPG
jgi:hypothetical protein